VKPSLPKRQTLFVSPMSQALAPALPLLSAHLQILAEIVPKKVQDCADGKAGNPSGGDISEPDRIKKNHNTVRLALLFHHTPFWTARRA
jgi:hypothetical protein